MWLVGTSRFWVIISVAWFLAITANAEAPSIVSPPTRQIVDAGLTATFTVTASGTAPLFYQWLFNGDPISGRTQSTLRISSAMPSNAGEYSVIVSNEAGTVTSDTATLTVLVYPPTWQTEPTNTTASIGQNVRFFAFASAAPPASYQWLFNDAAIPGAISSTLSLITVRATDAGQYSVIASNSEGSITSAVATLTFVPPRIGAGSVDLDFFPGTAAGAMISTAALQPDGRILIAGPTIYFGTTNQNGLARLHPDGTADFSFSRPNVPGSDTQFLQALPDGKILWNRSPGYLNRLLPNGTVDTNFLSSSAPNEDVLLIQNDGSIVEYSTSQYGYSFFRLNSDGLFDFTFNVTGYQAPGGTLSPIYRFVAHSLPDNKIIIGGHNVRRLHRHGAADFAFEALVGPVSHVVTKLDGKIFVSGTFTNVGGVARLGLALLNADGSLDASFNPAPALRNISSMALQPDGKLLVLSSNRLTRLHPDGSLDSSFDAGLGANSAISSILLQPDCKILVVGNFFDFDGYRRRGIVRLNNDPPATPTITRPPASQTVTQGATVTFTVEHSCVPVAEYKWWRDSVPLPGQTNAFLRLVAQDSGEYSAVVSNAFSSVASAPATLTVTAPLADPGFVDITFGEHGGADGTVRTMAYQSDGKLIVAGWFRELDGIPRRGIARLNADGSVDTTFDPEGGPNDRIYQVAVDPGGRILVAGAFTNFNGQARGRLARLLPDGALDQGFAPYFDAPVRAIAVQADGKIVAGGAFNSVDGQFARGLVRLNPDGTRDTSFTPYSYVSFLDVDALAVQPDGKVWAAGLSWIRRFATNGAVEFPNAVPPAPLFTGRARSIVIQPDGKILVAFGPQTSSGGIQGVSTMLLPMFRLNPNGSFDTNFANYPAIPGPGHDIYAVHLHTCGRILIAGSFEADFNLPRRMDQLARLTADGRLDPEFPIKTLDGNVYAIAVDSEKRMVIGGEFSKVDHAVRNGIARLHAEPYGPPILFEQPVSQTTNAGRELVLSVGVENCSDYQYQWQFNGTNVSGATNATLLLANARTRDAGEYRLTVRNGPHITISEPAQVQIIREPRHPGSADVDFFPPRDLQGWVQALALDTNGNLLAGGSFTSIGGRAANRVARFDRSGAMDPGFNAYSNLLGTVYGLARQPDGKILVAGSFERNGNYLLMRLMPNGSVDTNFAMPFGTGAAYGVAALPDGKILLAGPMMAQTIFQSSIRNGIARFLADGRLDTNFAAGVRYPLAFTQQRDGRILIGGTFTNIVTPIGQVPRIAVARLLPNGPADPTFDSASGPNAPVTAVVLSPDEKVYIGGGFSEVAGVSRRGIARLNHDGSVDRAFDPGSGMNSVWALAVQTDGKILAGGSFRFVNGLSRPGVVRFNVDGSVDTTFDPGTGVDAQVFAMLFDPTGKIYIGGNFTEYNGYPRDRVARINGDMFLLNPARIGGSFQLSLFTFFGETYVLEFSDSLTNPRWTPGSSLIGDGTIRSLTDPLHTGATGWYRVRNEP